MSNARAKVEHIVGPVGLNGYPCDQLLDACADAFGDIPPIVRRYICTQRTPGQYTQPLTRSRIVVDTGHGTLGGPQTGNQGR